MPSRQQYEELLRLVSPDTLKGNLIRAAVYIIAYEFLENVLRDHLEDFYGLMDDDSLKSWDGKGKINPGKAYARS